MAAALLGVWTAAEGSGALTLSARTSTSGSLITVTPGVWPGVGANSLATPTDNKSNTYTEAGEINLDNTESGQNGYASIAYNLPSGTRGTSHTISEADNGSNSLGAQEWSGIATSPTVATSATAAGTSTAPSASQAVSASSLAILVFGYALTTTTFTVNDGTLAQEIDENSDQQAVGVHYKVSQTGTPSITATLAASRPWGARLCCFTESGGAAFSPPHNLMLLGVGR